MPIKLKTKIPGPESLRLMAERQKHVAQGPFHTTPIFAKKAQGALVEDVDGNVLLDFAAGIGVVNVGHGAKEVVKAISDQAQELIHTSFNVMPYEGYVKLAKALNESTPGTFAKKTFLANSGAEAVENAIKMARAYTGRQAVICFDHAFHGRTYMAMTLTSKTKPYKAGFGPYNGEVYRAPYPYCYRWPNTSEPKVVAEECFAQFADLVNHRVGANQVAAVILEPVLGEGGFVPASKEFLQKLRAFCDENKIVLIADEIQTGFGRTGTLYASEQLGLVPDLMTIAKGLGGGMPISAVTGKAEIMDAPCQGGIGGTFGGNPVSCAAALAVFDLFADGKMLTRSKEIGKLINNRLLMMQETCSAIGDVRGLGPMQAVELVTDRKTKNPDPVLAKKMIQYAFERGLVIMSSGTYGNVIRLLVPLTVSDEQIKQGLDIIEAGFREFSKA